MMIDRTMHPSARRRLLAAVLCAAATIPAALAQTGPVPAAAGEVLFEHARLIDGTGATAKPDMAVLVRDGAIVSVMSQSEASRVSGAKVVDLSGKTLLPGLISDHSHTGLVSGTQVGSNNYTRENILAALKQYTQYGVLTVMSLGLNKSPLFDQLRREQHAGQNPGADLFGVDQGISAPNGIPPANTFHITDDQIFRPGTPDEARHDVDTMIDEGTDVVKLWVDDFRNDVVGAKGYPKLSPEIYKAAIDEAHRRHVRVAVHIHDLAVAKSVVAAGADILAHGVRDKPVDQALIDAMRTHDTWYIATLDLDEANYVFALHPEWLNNPFLTRGLSPELRAQFADPAWRARTLAAATTPASRYAVSVNQHNLLRLYRAGIKIGFGTDSGAAPTRVPGFAEHRELALTVGAGLTPLQAITLATGHAAALIGLNDRGIIAPGRRADLLIVDGTPDRQILDIDRVAQVWQRGALVYHAD